MTKKLRVLIVEDSEDDAELVLRELRSGGYEPLSERVDTHKAMADALKRQMWDVITIDYSMPHFNGLQALKLLRKSALDIPCIIVSGKIGEETAVALMKAGANDYVMKGNLKRLASAIEREVGDTEVRRERKRAEEALSIKDIIVTSSINAIALADLKGNLTYVNPAFLEMWGYSRSEEVLGEPSVNFWQMQEKAEAIIEALRSSGKWRGELIARRKDGSCFDVQLSGNMVIDETGHPIYMSGAFIDITERKQAEDFLLEAKEFSGNLITSARDGISVLDNRGVHIDVNPALCEMTGFLREELIGVGPPHPYWPPEQYEEIDRNFQKTMAADFTDVELTFMRKNGERFPVIVSPSAVKDKQGNVISYFATVKDVTERKQAEEAIKESEEKFRNVFDNSTIGKSITSIDGTVNVNQAFADMLGYTKEELSHIKWQDVSLPEEIDEINRKLESLQAGREKFARFVKRYVEKDGSIVWADVSTVLQRDSDGKPLYYITAIQDITERKLSEEKLVKSYESVQKTLNDAINTMVKIVEMRDPYTSGHQRKVADLAIAIAGEMKLEDTRIDQLRIAAVIHDIGKIYVPSDILSKPGRLSDIEFSLIKAHAQNGYDIVKGMDFPCNVAKAVLQHHERLDSSGYPNGLKSEDTLLEAKILAVADVVEAMSSHRPYRQALGIDKALEEISRNKGRLYDPDVVDACFKLFNSGKFEFKSV